MTLTALLLLGLLLLTRAAVVLGLMRLWLNRARLTVTEACLAALLVDHLAQIALMSLLSLPGALTMPNYRLAYGSFALAIVLAAVKFAPGPLNGRAVWATVQGRLRVVHLPVLVLAVLALGLVLVRAAFFFDTTYDSLTYNLTKLGFYAQHHSVFYLSGLSDLRIDAYERNGELAFLHNLLITGDTRWLALGGVDAWLLILCSLVFLLRTLGVGRALAVVMALFIALSPVVFGLSGVTKGDALATGCLVAATGWLLRCWDEGFSQVRFFLFAAALALAVTAKISAAFAAAGLAGLLMIRLTRQRQWPRAATCLLITVAATVCFAKGLQNVLVYRNPFQRSSLEQTTGGFATRNLKDGLAGAVPWYLGLQRDSLPWGHHGDLEKGLGLAGIAGLVFLAVSLVAVAKGASPGGLDSAARLPILLAAAILAGASVLLLGMVPWRGEGFAGNAMRYLLPYVLPLLGLAFGLAGARLQPTTPLLASLALLGGYHWLCDTNASNTLSHLGRGDLVRRILHYDRFSARFGYFEKQLGDAATAQQVRAEQSQPRSLLVIPQQSDLPLFWLFGDNLNWRITVLKEGAATPEALAQTNFAQAAVIWRPAEPKVEPQLAGALQQAGWTAGSRCGFWAVYHR